MAATDTEVQEALAEVITLEEPLGPHVTEDLVKGQVVGSEQKLFRLLYDDTNAIHREARVENPHYIVGRKGAGKTAFLLGAAFDDNADVALLQSPEIYTEINRLLLRYAERNGPVVADNLAYIWEVLLFHAAILEAARSEKLPRSEGRERLWAYLSVFGDPTEIRTDDLLARVGAEMSERLLDAPVGLSFRGACWAIAPGGTPFSEAVKWLRKVTDEAGPGSLYVVVDNLEDLHRHLGTYAEVVTGLFRLVSRSEAGDRGTVPFGMRFAFPAELLTQLNALAANAEKDFRNQQTIRWSASELIVIVGNRLRTFLDIYFPEAVGQFNLPKTHDPADRAAAGRTLRALLPERVVSALGVSEDPVAYLMRHTQLLPRQLILLLNKVMHRAVRAASPGEIPIATPAQVVDGVAEAEVVILNNILSSYEYAYPRIGAALEMMKSHITVVEPATRLHKIFNDASVKRAGLEFDQFIDGCFAVGALGIVSGERGESHLYTEGDFSYTYVNNLRPREDRDHVCVHPIFSSILFDRRTVVEMSRDGHRPIYPYGSDPEHLGYQV